MEGKTFIRNCPKMSRNRSKPIKWNCQFYILDLAIKYSESFQTNTKPGPLYCFCAMSAVCKVSVFPTNNPRAMSRWPKLKWHDDQRRLSSTGKCIRKIQRLWVFRRYEQMCVRYYLWPFRREEYSHFLIGASGTRRSDWSRSRGL